MPPKQTKKPAYTGASTGAKISEFVLQEGFERGYRNREDITALPPGILVKGSQNVLTNTFRRVGIVKGFVLDGQRDSSGNPILSGYDWQRHTGDERHLRSGFDVMNEDGKLQYRFVADSGDKYDGNTFTQDQVYWIDLMSSLGDGISDAAIRFRYAEFWDFNDELKSMLLFVNSSSNIFMWTGAVSTVEATSWATGSISVLNATPTAAGSGYTVGDVLTITTGGTGGTASVLSVGVGGAVTSVQILTPGTGYTTGAGKVTTGGTGTGVTLDITTVVQGFIKLDLADGETAPSIGFLNTGAYTQQASVNTNVYTYDVAYGAYLVGISADPTGEPVNSVIHQEPVTIPNSAMSGIPDDFKNYIISTTDNQVYVSAVDDNSVYVSKTNDFTDYTFSSPRAVGEGAILTLDGVPTAILAQEGFTAIGAGKDFWYQTQFQLSADNTLQTLTVVRLKTTARQAPISQEATSKIKNNIFYVSQEPIVNKLGTAQNYLLSPQADDLSFPIVNDMNSYDLTDCSAFFNQKYGYVCVPKAGVTRIYNMTDDGKYDQQTGTLVKNHYWEAPIGYPMKCLAVIDGDLYGHSYQSSNTYKLFTGYTFDENAYEAEAAFSFENSGVRNMRKISTSAFTEGYITTNTKLVLTVQRELTGGSTATFDILGSDASIVQQSEDVASLGKDSLGKHPIGGESEFSDQTTDPPKFRVYKTTSPTPYFEQQKRYSSTGVNQIWEILATGDNAYVSSELPTDITQ